MPHGDTNAEGKHPTRLGLCLVDGFALMSYASVVEPYRAANRLAGRVLYSWTHVSVDGAAVHASNGAMVAADQSVEAPLACDIAFVFAGGDPHASRDHGVERWLRRQAADGTVIAGVSAGPYLMASAGLLDGYRATVHWEHRAAFAQAFARTALEEGLYAIDRRRVTCAGGLAGMDLALELIEREQGHRLAAQVADWFIRSEPRAADRPQRASLRDRYEIANDRVLVALARMEANMEEPLAREALAAIAGVSVRQLERLFAAHLGAGIERTYLAIRLAQSEQLLRSTSQSLTDIAFACGFRSSSHFSRAYKARTGRAPSADRRRLANTK